VRGTWKIEGANPRVRTVARAAAKRVWTGVAEHLFHGAPVRHQRDDSALPTARALPDVAAEGAVKQREVRRGIEGGRVELGGA
jgi:hypothetical protein